MTRREFFKIISGAVAASLLSKDVFARLLRERTQVDPARIAHAEGGMIFDRVKAAVDALGGISRFVKPGDSVVIKPNAAFAQTPAMGGNTTPDVLRAVIRLCTGAGAGSVTVVEHCLSAHGRFGTSSDPSGLTRAVLEEGARLLDAGTDPANYTEVELDAPTARSHAFISALLEADAVINVPRAKMHPWAGYTLCVKNLMGTMLNPGIFHSWKEWSRLESHYYGLLDRLGVKKYRRGYEALPENLVALARLMQDRVDLNIVDMTDLVRDWSAVKAGRLERKDTIIAGTDMVGVDAYCIGLFGEEPLGEWKSSSIDNYIRMMHEEAVGNADIRTARVIRDVLTE